MRRLILVGLVLTALATVGASSKGYLPESVLYERIRILTIANLEWQASEEERRLELIAVRAENQTLALENAILAEERDTAVTELDELLPLYREAAKIAGSVQDLPRVEAQISSLRAQQSALSAEMNTLRSQRDALASGLQTLADAYGAHGERVGIGNLACSPSMLPLLWCDDMVAGIQYPAENEVGVGDIVFYTWPEGSFWNPESREGCEFGDPRQTRQFVDHRVVRVFMLNGERYYETKGDAQGPDPCYVPHSAVWLKVTHIAHGIKYENAK